MRLDRLVNTTLLEKALDASVLKDEAINQNIANVDTPNYKRKQVLFEDVLKEAAQTAGLKGTRTDSRHMPIGEIDAASLNPMIVEDNTTAKLRIDGNNVDINQEMAEMAKNTIQYSMLAQKISGKFKDMKSVIAEGRK